MTTGRKNVLQFIERIRQQQIPLEINALVSFEFFNDNHLTQHNQFNMEISEHSR